MKIEKSTPCLRWPSRFFGRPAPYSGFTKLRNQTIARERYSSGGRTAYTPSDTVPAIWESVIHQRSTLGLLSSQTQDEDIRLRLRTANLLRKRKLHGLWKGIRLPAWRAASQQPGIGAKRTRFPDPASGALLLRRGIPDRYPAEVSGSHAEPPASVWCDADL